MNVTFSDWFGLRRDIIEKYGAFNISLLSDLPLFVDPFLLFNSKKPELRRLHQQIIEYLIFLRDKSLKGAIDPGLVKAWYTFPEVRQNWLGFSEHENRGSGLGKDFAKALNKNLNAIFRDFGKERVTQDSHIEKLCLIANGVGRDKISDFTTNLIKGFLLEYTQTFAQQHIDQALRRTIGVRKVRFNYETESWEPGTFDLPCIADDYVILTPKEILTRDDTWINKTDLLEQFEDVPPAIPNEQLRAQINNYFRSHLAKNATRKERMSAAALTLSQFPQLIDYYIKQKEERADQATGVSSEKVSESDVVYTKHFKELAELLGKFTGFYQISGDTYAEAYQRVEYLRDVIEDNDGYKVFYYKGKPIAHESDAHILYKLTWFASPSDINSEVNNGRGPVDFKSSRGSVDKTLIEFKLASNSQLKRNLSNQVEIYKQANRTQKAIKVIIYFTQAEHEKVLKILKELGLSEDKSIVLIDARADNKPSASKT